MLRRLATLSVLLCCAPALRAWATPPDALTVRVAQGMLQGERVGPRLRVFRGIPYAAPPVGPLRWRAPQSPAPWTGVRAARQFGDACMQGAPGAHKPGMSEDCLYLNVWTPATVADAKLPVMVWIHGGGFVGGAGAVDGAKLAGKGVVVVAINYRLGVFGFLAHPQLTQESAHHTSGNYGLADQIAALEWVQANIAAFGGDPKRVTLFGESAGGTSIGYLLVSPPARGLFAQAILESPSRLFLPDPMRDRRYAGLPAMESVGVAIDPSVEQLRRMSAPAVMERAAMVTNALFAPGGPERIGLRPESHVHIPSAHDQPWWAFADGYYIPEPDAVAYGAGHAATVPLLLGTNANEGSVFLHDFPLKTEEEYRRYLATNYAPCGEELETLYPGGTAAQIHSSVEQLITDAMFVYGVASVADAESRRERPVYVYRFSRVSPRGWATGDGAWHGAEVAYVFGEVSGGMLPGEYDAADARVSDEMMAAWVRFAETGNPGGGDLRWPAWNKNHRVYMEFGDAPAVGTLTLPLHLFAQVFSAERPARCSGVH